MLFCVVLKDRRAWEGIRYGKAPKTVAYLCLLKKANFEPSPRPPCVPPPRPCHVQTTIYVQWVPFFPHATSRVLHV